MSNESTGGKQMTNQERITMAWELDRQARKELELATEAPEREQELHLQRASKRFAQAAEFLKAGTLVTAVRE